MRAVVARCRERLQEGREKAGQQHRSGTPGFQISTQLADLYDDIVLDVWDEAVNELGVGLHAYAGNEDSIAMNIVYIGILHCVLAAFVAILPNSLWWSYRKQATTPSNLAS